jgi:4-aminobutyrate aminotransferase-like enzyme
MDWTSGTHTSTFSGNGPVCAATIATINVIQKEKLAERAAKLEKIIKPRLTEMMEKSKIIGEIRGKGLFWGMEIVKDKKTKAYARDEAGKICQSAFKRGLIILRGGLSSVRFWPPAIISEEILEKALDIIESSIKEVEKGL